MVATYLVAVIHIPLPAFMYQPGIGNEELPAVTQRLPSLICKTRCRPHRWKNRVKGIVDDGT